jgi:hypothetical protein
MSGSGCATRTIQRPVRLGQDAEQAHAAYVAQLRALGAEEATVPRSPRREVHPGR